MAPSQANSDDVRLIIVEKGVDGEVYRATDTRLGRQVAIS